MGSGTETCGFSMEEYTSKLKMAITQVCEMQFQNRKDYHKALLKGYNRCKIEGIIHVTESIIGRNLKPGVDLCYVYT